MPTRTGYSFVGWRGRNLVDVSKGASYKQGKVTYKINEDNSISMTNVAHVSDGTPRLDCVLIPLEDIAAGKYLFSFEEFSYSGECNTPLTYVCGRDSSDNIKPVGETINYSSGICSVRFDAANLDVIVPGSFQIEIYLSASVAANNFASFSSGSLSAKVMLVKLNDENEVINYEPYYITSDTVLNNIGDRTLTAMWKKDN